MGMVQTSSRPCFAAEPLHGFRITRIAVRKYLESDIPVQLAIARQIDLRHSPATQDPRQLVATGEQTVYQDAPTLTHIGHAALKSGHVRCGFYPALAGAAT